MEFLSCKNDCMHLLGISHLCIFDTSVSFTSKMRTAPIEGISAV